MATTNSVKVLENIYRKTNSIFMTHATDSEVVRKLGIGLDYDFDAETGFSYTADLLVNDNAFAVISSKYDPRKLMNLLDFDYRTLSEDDADDFISLLTTEDALARKIVADWKKHFDENIRTIFDSLCDTKEISGIEALELMEEVRNILDELCAEETSRIDMDFEKMTTDLNKFLSTL